MCILSIFTEDVDPKLTMVQLGMDSLMSSEIKQTLFRHYEIDLDIKEIQGITFEYLINLNKEKHISNFQKPDMPSKKHESICVIPKDTVVLLKSGTSSHTIFFLHPVEGHVQSMAELADRINATVYGLQSTKECQYRTIREYAMYYKEYIRQKQPAGPYILCGYSFGSLICLELAFILEAEGETVWIISVDGSPKYFKFAARKNSTNFTEPYDFSHYKKLEIFVLGFRSVDKEQVIIRNFLLKM